MNFILQYMLVYVHAIQIEVLQMHIEADNFLLISVQPPALKNKTKTKKMIISELKFKTINVTYHTHAIAMLRQHCLFYPEELFYIKYYLLFYHSGLQKDPSSNCLSTKTNTYY